MEIKDFVHIEFEKVEPVRIENLDDYEKEFIKQIKDGH